MLQWFDGGRFCHLFGAVLLSRCANQTLSEIDWKLFKTLYAHYFAMNAEVNRSLADEDFNIMRLKMHCAECSESTVETTSPEYLLVFRKC